MLKPDETFNIKGQTELSKEFFPDPFFSGYSLTFSHENRFTNNGKKSENLRKFLKNEENKR